MIEQVAAGNLDPGTTRSEIAKLTMRQNQWTVGAYCESYCRLVGLHHTIEDRSLFPGLSRLDSRLTPVTDRLHAEHVVIAGVLERVDARHWWGWSPRQSAACRGYGPRWTC
jgi:hypothetical protein